VDNVLTAHVVVSAAGESIAIEERVARTPGVRAAGLISLLPLQDSDWKAGFTIEGRPGVLQTELRYVTPGYFRAMGIPILRGRGFSPHDGPDVPRRIIVNEALARQYFPNEDPIGRQTDRGTIIGIAGDVRQASLRVPAKPEIFYTVAQNFAQIRRLGSTLVVRGHAQVNSIREAVREVSPGQALFRVATMRRVIEESLAPERLYAWLLALFAAMAALMAMAGIYGVISYLVTLRTREFGIRMAIGADPSRVKRLVLGGGARLITIGLALGLAAATLLTRLLGALLYGIEPTDLSTFSLMAALLAAAALAACLIPARRAAGVNPSVALRSE
jgi:putative ABC transport system permease protein